MARLLPDEHETRGEFLRRAIPIVIDDGTCEGGKAAADHCNKIYNDHFAEENTKKKTWKNK